MKALFLVLVLANLLYAGWRMWIVPAAAPPAFVEAAGVPQLELIEATSRQLAARDVGDEPDDRGLDAGTPPPAAAARADEQRPATQGDAPATDNAPAGTGSVAPVTADPGATGSAAQPEPGELAMLSNDPARCVSLGPFLNLREATEATAMLNEVGLQPSQRLSESQVWFGHWVHLPEQRDRETAVAIVEDLREKGISDIYIEPSGEFRNFISLGVFTDAAHAETRAGHIRRLGVSPQIQDRYRDSSVYWVDFALPAERDIDPTRYQASPSRVLRLEERDCPSDTG